MIVFSCLTVPTAPQDGQASGGVDLIELNADGTTIAIRVRPASHQRSDAMSSVLGATTADRRDTSRTAAGRGFHTWEHTRHRKCVSTVTPFNSRSTRAAPVRRHAGQTTFVIVRVVGSRGTDFRATSTVDSSCAERRQRLRGTRVQQVLVSPPPGRLRALSVTATIHPISGWVVRIALCV